MTDIVKERPEELRFKESHLRIMKIRQVSPDRIGTIGTHKADAAPVSVRVNSEPS